MGESPGPLEKHRNFTDHNRKSFDFGKLFRLQPENFGFLLCFSAGKEGGRLYLQVAVLLCLQMVTLLRTRVFVPAAEKK